MMGSVDCIFSSDDIVVKPPNDKRLYRTIELHNGLCALLVNDPEIYRGGCPRHSNSEDEQEAGTGDEDGEEEEEFEDGEEEEEDDEEEEEDEEDGDFDGKDEENGEIQPGRKGSSSQTKKAAAAMCVGMGSFSDPLEAQGLAHFLEHMLFMGSKDFPDENEYDSYLSEHGGSSNAYTETEHTCYHFEVKREYLRGALKRFCKMMLAVFSNFSAIHLLIVIPSIDFLGAIRRVSLKQWRGVNLREQILKMYHNYYHGQLMKLVVIGGAIWDWWIEVGSISI